MDALGIQKVFTLLLSIDLQQIPLLPCRNSLKTHCTETQPGKHRDWNQDRQTNTETETKTDIQTQRLKPRQTYKHRDWNQDRQWTSKTKRQTETMNQEDQETDKDCERKQTGKHTHTPDTGTGLPVPDANGLIIRGTEHPWVLLPTNHHTIINQSSYTSTEEVFLSHNSVLNIKVILSHWLRCYVITFYT